MNNRMIGIILLLFYSGCVKVDIDRVNEIEMNEEIPLSYDFSQNVYLKYLQVG